MSENKGLIINNIQIIDNNLQINYKPSNIKSTLYNCVKGKCINDEKGQYKSLQMCQYNCETNIIYPTFRDNTGYPIIKGSSKGETIILNTRPTRVISYDSYNLLGGSISYNIDLSQNKDDINASGYLIFPKGIFNETNYYCDGSGYSPICFETDLSETNGRNAIATTWHSIIDNEPYYYPNPCMKGKNNCACDQNGCAKKSYFSQSWFDKGECTIKGVLDASIINTQYPFTVYTQFTKSGEMTTWYMQKGSSIEAFNNKTSFNNDDNKEQKPLKGDQEALKNQMNNYGAVLVFSLWQAWSPLQNFCKAAPKGSILDSQYTISNIKVNGVIVQKSI